MFQSLKTWVYGLFLLIFLSVEGFAGTAFYVSAGGGDASWDGRAPAWDGVHGPKRTIQAAINVSADGDIVIAAPGTYVENVKFLGKAVTVRSQEPASWAVVESTIIDGNGTGSCVEFEYDEDLDSILDGFTLINKKGGGSTAVCEFVSYGPLTLTHCGGAVLCEFSSPTVRRCVMRGINNDGGWGGGIAIIGDSHARIQNCFIVENKAYYGGGAVVYNFTPDTCQPVFDHCTFAVNYSTAEFPVAPTLRDCYAVDCRLAKPYFSNSSFYNSFQYDIKKVRDLLLNDPSRVSYCSLETAGQFTDTEFKPTLPQIIDLTGVNGNIDVYPGFVSTGEICPLTASCQQLVVIAGDYHLAKNSPCLDAGDPAFHAPADLDIDGQPRLMGIRTDIGADEIIPLYLRFGVVQPQSGDVWAAESQHAIRWDSIGYPSMVEILFSSDNGVTWSPIGAPLVANTGTYLWTLPAGLDSNQCFVKVHAAELDGEIEYGPPAGPFTIHPSAPGPAFVSDWPTLGGAMKRPGISSVNGPETGCLKWRFDAPDPLHGGVVLGADQHLHVSSQKGKIFTLDAGGNLLWTYDTQSEFASSPTVGRDGTIYAGGWNGMLYAIDKDGHLRWNFRAGDMIIGAPAVSPENAVFLGTADGKVIALAENGSFLWEFQVGPADKIRGAAMAPITLGIDGSVYAGTNLSSILYALDPASGAVRWQHDFARNVVVDPAYPQGRWIYGKIVFAPIVATDGTIYVAPMGDTYLYALNFADGSEAWSLDLADPASGLYGPGYQNQYYRCAWSEPVLGPDGTIYVSFGTEDSFLRAVTPAGAIAWVKKLGVAGEFTMTVGGNGFLYAAGLDKSLYILDSAGETMSYFDAGEDLSYPVIGTDGTLYMVDGAGALFALQFNGCAPGDRTLRRPWDFNADGVADTDDSNLIRDQWLRNTAGRTNPFYLPADANHDQKVNALDLLTLRKNWLTEY